MSGDIETRSAMNWNFERVAGPFNGPMTGVAWNGTHVLFALPDEMVVKRFDPQSGHVDDYRRYTGRVNGLAVGLHGNLFVAQESGRRVVELLADGSAEVTATRLDGAIHNFPCDVAVDRRGRVWFSDSYTGVQVFGPRIFPLLKHASVLRLERDDRRSWKLRRITFDTVAPRAVLLSHDEQTLFVSEGGVGRDDPRELRAYPVRDDGSVGPFRVLLAFGADHTGVHRGIEGLCLDRDHRVVACGGAPGVGQGPAVYVFSAAGQLVEVHALPPQVVPARCRFGDHDLTSLYVSASDGCLYRARMSELHSTNST